MKRRRLLQTAAGLGALVVLRPVAAAPAPAPSPVLDVLVQGFANNQPVGTGRVKLGISPLIENGNAAPLTVTVDSPMTAADHVKRIAIFNEKNPERDVAIFTLGPRAGRASVSTRMRLATSQRLVAVAELSDGSFWQDRADVIVTLAACIEE